MGHFDNVKMFRSLYLVSSLTLKSLISLSPACCSDRGDGRRLQHEKKRRQNEESGSRNKAVEDSGTAASLGLGRQIGKKHQRLFCGDVR